MVFKLIQIIHIRKINLF